MRTHSMLVSAKGFSANEIFLVDKAKANLGRDSQQLILLPQPIRKRLQPLRAAYGVLRYLFNSEQQVYSTLNAHFPQEKCRLLCAIMGSFVLTHQRHHRRSAN